MAEYSHFAGTLPGQPGVPEGDLPDRVAVFVPVHCRARIHTRPARFAERQRNRQGRYVPFGERLLDPGDGLLRHMGQGAVDHQDSALRQRRAVRNREIAEQNTVAVFQAHRRGGGRAAVAASRSAKNRGNDSLHIALPDYLSRAGRLYYYIQTREYDRFMRTGWRQGFER